MSILPESAKAYIGVQAETEIACDRVERGEVRRYSQAILDPDPIYWQDGAATARYGGPVAPALFPTHMFRRAFGTPDPVQASAHDPDYDGSTKLRAGLPEIEPLRHLAVLNGGSEVEFYRYARHGDTVKLRAHYADIFEKQTSKGPMIFVISESDYLDGNGELLMRVRHTRIRRPA
jgi:N-terminal half of MaoC dehydratase